MENITTTPITDALPEPLPIKEEAVTEEKKEEKPARKPRVKTRNAEELLDATLKSMSEKEKNLLINYLKDEINKKDAKIDLLQNNTESAFAQTRQTEQQYEAMERYYRDRLGYINNQVKAFSDAIGLAITGGTK
jgi:hypothetical protein